MNPVHLEFLIWILWTAWVFLAIFSVYNIWAYPHLMASEDAASRTTADAQEAAFVIVPIKGVSALTEDFLRSLLNQDYPRYRLVFCYESESDPAAAFLRSQLALGEGKTCCAPAKGDRLAASGLSEVLLVCAGHSRDCGQKIHNQIAAIRKLEAGDRLIAFADADMLCQADWLSRLLAPLNSKKYHLAGAYRWFIPEHPRFTSLLASVINASVATLGGRESYNMLWGGSMALTREAFEKLQVPDLFEGSLNDDLHLARAARRAGYRIGYVRSLLLPSPIDFTPASFVEFTRRQYYQVRHYTPKFYAGALLATNVYTLAWVSSLAAALSGYWPAWLPWLTVNLVLDQARAMGRFRLMRILFDAPALEKLRRTRPLEHLATPFWMALHGVLGISAIFMGRVSWSGVTYRVFGRKKIDIIKRAEA